MHRPNRQGAWANRAREEWKGGISAKLNMNFFLSFSSILYLDRIYTELNIMNKQVLGWGKEQNPFMLEQNTMAHFLLCYIVPRTAGH